MPWRNLKVIISILNWNLGDSKLVYFVMKADHFGSMQFIYLLSWFICHWFLVSKWLIIKSAKKSHYKIIQTDKIPIPKINFKKLICPSLKDFIYILAAPTKKYLLLKEPLHTVVWSAFWNLSTRGQLIL